MPDPPGAISCSGCGRRFQWKPELAGKNAKCPCGQMIAFPAEPPADDLYDLADPPPPVKSAASAPSKPAAAPASPLNYRTPQPRPGSLEAEERFAPENLRDIQAPLILLGIGIIVQLIAAWITGSRGGGFSQAMLGVAADLFLDTAIMLIAVLIAARFRGIHLGSFWTAILKLAAISVVPPATVLLLYPLLVLIPFGWVVSLVIEFCLYFALLGFFFDLDQDDTWYCVAVMFIVTVAISLGKPMLAKWL